MFLGLDLGTSALKAVLLDESGQLKSEASAPLSSEHPKPLWSEQNPDAWWSGLKLVLAELGDTEDLGGIQAIGIAGQMHGATLLDASSKVLRPCILWNDGRSQLECEELETGLDDFQSRSGNLAMPGFTAPKLLWLKRHEPDVFTRIHKVLLPKDYLLYRLTGLYATDMSDASGTLWLNPAIRGWDAELIGVSSMGEAQMPTLFEGCDIVGNLELAVAAELGLPVVPVVAGGGDNACGAVGIGAVSSGDAFISLGTSGVFFVVSDTHRPAPQLTVHAFCHCLPKLWHQMSVSLSAASSLSWLARLLDRSEAELINALQESSVRSTPVIFLPYLSGERTPHNDPDASGVFYGLSNSTGPLDLTLAVMEGVAFSLADGQRALLDAGADIGDVSLLGGGTRSSLWCQILADVLQRPLVLRDTAKAGPAFGAARLAQMGFEHADRQRRNEICQKPLAIETFNVSPTREDYYQNKISLFRELYQQTKATNSLWRKL